MIIEAQKRLWFIVIPTLLASLANEGTITLNMLFITQLNNPNITAGVGMAMIYTNFTAVSILHGMNQAITVMVAVSYGHQDWRNCETILQRGRLICMFAYIPMAIIIANN